MNQKATKQTLTLPFNFQMMVDDPVIDPTFKNAEKVNAPYINDMITPVWVQDTKSKAIYDKDGHRYEIKDGYLTRDGENLFEVNDKKFIREDITEDLYQYHDYDLTDNYEAYTIWNSEYNSFYLFIGSEGYATPSLYSDGVVVASRVRIIGDTAYLVVYYDEDDIGYIDITALKADGTVRHFNKEVKWYSHQIRRNTSTNPIYVQYSLENASPIINIGKVENDIIGISMVSKYGSAINSSQNYFATYFLTANDLYQLGDTAKPTSETSSIEVTNTTAGNFRFDSRFTSSSKTIAVITSDDTVFYDYTDNTKGEVVTFPATYAPTDTGNTVTIDGTVYKIYNASGVEYTATLKLTCSDATQIFSFTCKGNYKDIEVPLASETSVDGVASVSESIIIYRGEDAPSWSWSDCEITWLNETTEIDDWSSGRYFTVTRTSTETVNAGWLVSPNIVIDDGSLYSFWRFQLGYSEGNNWNNQYLTAGNLIEESGVISSYTEENSQLTYTISPTEYVTVTSNYNVARSNSFILNQNIAIDTVKLNNQSATSAYSLYNNGGTAGSESTSSKFLEYSNSNCADLRYYPGTTRDTSFNYFGNQMFSGDTVVGNVEDQPLFVVQGYRTAVHSADRFLLGNRATPFNILYNVDASNTCLPQGISYSNDTEEMGTLLTPWQTIDDDFYIAANTTSVVYRDKSNRYYKITIEDGNDLTALLDDRFILVNTTSYWNMFDSTLLKKFHYATDYNDRVMFGQTAVPTTILPGANSSGIISYSRYTATSINAAYTIMPMYAVSSILLPRANRTRVGINAEKPFRCLVGENTDTQPIDIYFGDIGGTTALYRYSIYPYLIYDRVIKFDLQDSSYTVTDTSYLSPNIFTEYISGAGNNDMVKETYSTYRLTYYDQIPFFLYSASTEVAAKNGEEIKFFVLQGQFYACMNEKIYSMIYSSGAISSQDAIIDIRGMKFIGNNPQIAFFWDPRSRAIRSFTGDAILQHIWNANKFTELRQHWYDETTQSIYVATDIGLLVLGDKNTYLFENWKNVTNCQFDNKETTHITDNGVTYNLRYYPTEDYEILPLDIETSFYGIGNNEYTAIDRWDIVLYDAERKHSSTEITVGVRTITDITVKSEEKTFKITPDMWDKWSNSVLLRYVPKLQKGQGIRLYLKTPMVVQRVVPHIMDMQTGTPTKRGM